MDTSRAPGAVTTTQKQRRMIRYLAAAIAAITAVMYLLIGFGVIVMYVVVGQERTPAFETWGITIKILQVVLLGALLYLALRPPERVDDATR
ncbi:MAG TPA: hypothetical protein VFF55_09780 [Candidatus Deferrimicrobium sp.]|nr:hypothetical protein [Candidatus Deferrimicrobium sp.]